MEAKTKISTRQHTFTEDRPNKTKLFLWQNHRMDDKSNCIYWDFSKAFDLMFSNNLIWRTCKMIIALPILLYQWIKHEFSDSSQNVAVSGETSIRRGTLLSPSGKQFLVQWHLLFLLQQQAAKSAQPKSSKVSEKRCCLCNLHKSQSSPGICAQFQSSCFKKPQGNRESNWKAGHPMTCSPENKPYSMKLQELKLSHSWRQTYNFV